MRKSVFCVRSTSLLSMLFFSIILRHPNSDVTKPSWQKRVLGKCHPSFARLLLWHTERFPEGRGHGHNKALYGHNGEISHCQRLFSRSIFAMVDIYNNLPQHVVDNSTVSEFQSYLNHLAYTRCQQGDVSWSSSFCRRTQYGINGVNQLSVSLKSFWVFCHLEFLRYPSGGSGAVFVSCKFVINVTLFLLFSLDAVELCLHEFDL